MGMLEGITAELPSKKFGNMTIYFDKHSNDVRLIEHCGRYTYVIVRMVNDEAKHYLKTELSPGTCVDCPITLHDTWVIPDPLALERAEEVEGAKTKDDVAQLLSDKVFQIVSYTIVDSPTFKGSNFSNSVIMVIVENAMGKRYAVPYLLDDDVHGGDEKPAGSIMGEAYKFTPLGTLSENGTFFVQL